MTVTEETTREDVEEALGHLNHSAKRCWPVVGAGDTETDWDRMHAKIDAQLDARERLAVLV